MGTRSLTFVYNERNNPIINLYRQYDGYPSGHGAELAEFLAGKTIVNGLSGDTSMVFNGMGCLAASLVAHFKDAAGGFYLHAVSETDLWQDYEYHIYADKILVKGYNGNEVFSGNWELFSKFCGAEELV
jgi:hypothetical protein